MAAAYSRACEASCDRYGAYVTREIEGAVRAMMTLSGGKEAGKTMSGENFSRQHSENRGFFISWYELISGYPTASQRVANLLSMKTGVEYPKCPRHWLSYVFAFFTFGGNAGGTGNFLVTIVIVAMLAAIAIPNLLRAKLEASDRIAQKTLSQMAKAAEAFAKDHDGRYPVSADELLNGNKKYLTANYCGKVLRGFSFNCTFGLGSFQFTATPVKIGITGTEVFIVTERDFNDDVGDLEEARKKVDADFAKLNRLIEGYHKEFGQWPSDAQGSLSGVWKPTHPNDTEPMDPFDNQPYGYRKYADHYELLSCGPDQESNTKDDIVYKFPLANAAP